MSVFHTFPGHLYRSDWLSWYIFEIFKSYFQYFLPHPVLQLLPVLICNLIFSAFTSTLIFFWVLGHDFPSPTAFNSLCSNISSLWGFLAVLLALLGLQSLSVCWLFDNNDPLFSLVWMMVKEYLFLSCWTGTVLSLRFLLCFSCVLWKWKWNLFQKGVLKYEARVCWAS